MLSDDLKLIDAAEAEIKKYRAIIMQLIVEQPKMDVLAVELMLKRNMFMAIMGGVGRPWDLLPPELQAALSPIKKAYDDAQAAYDAQFEKTRLLYEQRWAVKELSGRAVRDFGSKDSAST